MLTALLANIRNVAKHQLNGKPSSAKSTYFDRNWGKELAFRRSIGKAVYDILLPEEKNIHQLNEGVLVRFRTPIQDDRSDFVVTLATESREFLDEKAAGKVRTVEQRKALTESMAVLVERLFELLKAYGLQLNNELGFGPFHLSATNPQFVTEVIKFNKLRQAEETATYYRARLSTSRASLVIRGDFQGIAVYFLPVERAIGLSGQESIFQPFLRVRGHCQEGSIAWITESGWALQAEDVEKLARELFRELVRRTTEQIALEN